MKQLISLLILVFFLAYCSGQKKYFRPKGIVDKTEQYKLNKTGWINLKNKESVDGYTRIGDLIYGGEISCNVKPLSDININSFKVLPGTKYAKDTNHVYYPLNISCVDFEDCGVCYYEKIIIEKADPKTFRYLGKDYSTDGHNVFFRGILLPNADGQTFKVIDGSEYFYFAADKNKVFIHDKIFESADPMSFYYDKQDERNNDSEFGAKYIIGDKNNEWEFIPPDKVNRIDKK